LATAARASAATAAWTCAWVASCWPFAPRYGLTQDEVARVVAASGAATISQWESGRAVPDGVRRERLRELLDGRLWPELRAALLGGESFPALWREAVRWYRRASREVPARATWGVLIRRMLDSLLRVEDLAGLRLAYVEAGPMGSAGAALRTTDAAAERRVEDAAFGMRWLEMAHAGRFDLKRSLTRQLPPEWLRDPPTAPSA
jgi:transcriptional regulator with XRE-family HTH domain